MRRGIFFGRGGRTHTPTMRDEEVGLYRARESIDNPREIQTVPGPSRARTRSYTPQEEQEESVQKGNTCYIHAVSKLLDVSLPDEHAYVFFKMLSLLIYPDGENVATKDASYAVYTIAALLATGMKPGTTCSGPTFKPGEPVHKEKHIQYLQTFLEDKNSDIHLDIHPQVLLKDQVTTEEQLNAYIHNVPNIIGYNKTKCALGVSWDHERKNGFMGHYIVWDRSSNIIYDSNESTKTESTFTGYDQWFARNKGTLFPDEAEAVIDEIVVRYDKIKHTSPSQSQHQTSPPGAPRANRNLYSEQWQRIAKELRKQSVKLLLKR